ncbi:hypothetical protein T07_5957 [Trichinella nelsoni]|uniref:Uncharacterized protein n=1 Tax=Trichinella nelsoni TaxID=6336 RepID=A0A0V0S2K5_9BILA|nr:hypothetical protein T07_5957 [Trichinella nelsoni]
MNVKACSNEGAGELTRLHDELNRHFLELKALRKEVNSFFGSAELDGTSLNLCLDPGPKLQPDLVAILLCFCRS